jgi:FixJ family two-component response regulator
LKGTDTVENSIRNSEITVLLVSDNDADIREVKKHLEKTMGRSCHIWHCPSVIRSTGFFKKALPGIDIILLDLDLVSSAKPREIFRQMQNIVGSVPIIVFTERKDHELALMVVEEGAADNVTRGQFGTDPYKLRDAIEFSLARNRISKNIELKNVANLTQVSERGATYIKGMKKHEETALEKARIDADAFLKQALREAGWRADIVLNEALEHGRNDLKEAGRYADAILEEVLDHGRADLREANRQADANLLQFIEQRRGIERRAAFGHGPLVSGEITERRSNDRRAHNRHTVDALKAADTKAAAVLKGVHEVNDALHREKDQIIHWMSGGYSM